MKTLKIFAVAAAATFFFALNALPATFFVTKSEDTNDGICDALDCSLREAVREANLTAGADVIELASGVYVLTVSGQLEEAAASGDLDVTEHLTVNGAERDSTLIAGSTDRAFEVHPGATLNLLNMTLLSSSSSLSPTGVPFDLDQESGGAIRNRLGATLTLTDVDVSSNSAFRARGGGVFNQGTATLLRVEVLGNQAGQFFTQSQNLGGGIYNTGNLTVLDSAIVGNSAHSGGGLFNNGGDVTLRNSTIASNQRIGIFNAGSLTLDYSTVAENTSSVFPSGPTALVNEGSATVSSTVLNTSFSFSGVNTVCGGSVALVSGGHNVVQDSSCGVTFTADLEGVDTLLKIPGEYGGPTRTMLPLGNSPAVGNGGFPALAADQRGMPRSDGAPDSGAAERQPSDFFLSIAGGELIEGNSGTQILAFSVQLDSPSAFPVSVDWTTADGDSSDPAQNAVAPVDYLAASGTVVFSAGSVTQPIEIVVNGDFDIEDRETFRVTLLNPNGAQLGQSSVGFGAIVNDDFTSAVAFNDDNDRGEVTANEGDSTTVQCVFPVRLTGVPLTAPATVKYRTIAEDATDGVDYVGVVENTLTFAPGPPREVEIRIDVLPDLIQEFDEAFVVEMYDAVGVELRDSSSGRTRTSVDFPCRIQDNDGPRPITVSSGSVTESRTAIFEISLDRPREGISVDFETQPGTAIAGLDYVHRSGTVTFGQSATEIIEVPILNDTMIESNESFFLQLSNPTSPGELSIDRGEIEIHDDDAQLVVVPASVTSATGVTNVTPTGLLITMPMGRRTDINVDAQVTCFDLSTPTTVSLIHRGISFPMFPISLGLYRGTIPAAQVGNGSFGVTATCSGILSTVTLGRITLYDPSGVITDAHTGAPVVGATVTLYRVPGWEAKTGPSDVRPNTCESNASRVPGAPWSQPAPVALGVPADPVADADLFEPDLNPQTTNVDGWYGWDVAAGCWFVIVDAAGYRSLVSPVVGVPPAVLDLNLALRLLTADDRPPALEFNTTPDPNENGWWQSDVSVLVTADDGPDGSGVASITCGSVTQPGSSLSLTVIEEAENTISCSAVDADGNTSAPALVTVRIDRTAPVVNAPPDVNRATATNADSCSIPIDDATLGTATTTDNLSEVTVVRTGVPAGNLFPVGTMVITFTGTDAAGNSSVATQLVIVADATPPVISGGLASPSVLSPADGRMVDVAVGYATADCQPVSSEISVSSSEADTGAPDWEVLDAHHVRLRAELAAGSTERRYTLTITARDEQSNLSSTQVIVIVRNAVVTPCSRLREVESELIRLIGENPGSNLAQRLSGVLEKVRMAIEKGCRIPPYRQGATDRIAEAAGDLEDALEEGVISNTDAIPLLQKLAEAARMFAQEAIADAMARGGNKGQITAAQNFVRQADKHVTRNRFEDACAKYEDAVNKAEGA
jgi:CSLREA domain-containing protein